MDTRPNVGDITSEVVTCPQCTEPEVRFSSITAAIVVVLAVILIYYLVCLGVRHVRGEGFVSPQAQEVFSQSRDLFTKSNGGTTYSEYKATVANSDPVQFDSVKTLWKNGKLSPSEVQKVL